MQTHCDWSHNIDTNKYKSGREIAVWPLVCLDRIVGEQELHFCAMHISERLTSRRWSRGSPRYYQLTVDNYLPIRIIRLILHNKYPQPRRRRGEGRKIANKNNKSPLAYVYWIGQRDMFSVRLISCKLRLYLDKRAEPRMESGGISLCSSPCYSNRLAWNCGYGAINNENKQQQLRVLWHYQINKSPHFSHNFMTNIKVALKKFLFSFLVPPPLLLWILSTMSVSI